MRNLIVLLFLFAIQNLSAQTGQGGFLVGSNVSAYYSETGSGPSRTRTINSTVVLNPKIGFFILNNLCLGASIPFSKVKATYSSGYNAFDYYETVAQSGGIGPFLRYYFPIKKIQLITEVSYSWNSVNAESIYYDELLGGQSNTETKTKSNVFSAASGVGIFLSDNITLEFLLNYQDSVYDIMDSYGWNELDQKHFLLSAGIQFYLQKKTS